ncbi:MAG: glycosyltransferase family 2 protein [Deltaproteobacteria bacterium]|nr:glycosyltransferase family 2 protein [Deltaproteobacteria bacterium]
MKIWMVLPAYNEEDALPRLIDSLVEQLREENREFEILVVNDGSEDRTWEVAEAYSGKAPIRLYNNETNRGLAETLRTGLLEALKLAAKDDIIITMDADNTHPAGLVVRMVRLIREGNDVVIASRYRKGSYVRGVPLSRRLLSYGASWLCRLLFPIRGVRDYTCGYRAYRVTALSQLISRYGEDFISEKGFASMVDILLRLREQELIFTEVPLILRYDLKPGRSKMNVSRTIKETLNLLVRRRCFPNKH